MFKVFSFTASSAPDSTSTQSCVNSWTRNAQTFGDSLLRKSLFEVQSENFVGVDVFPSQGHVQFPWFIPNYHTTTPLTYICKEAYKGFVYNLSVADDESYCVGKDSIAVHNCRCMLVGARDDWGYTDTARVIMAPPDVSLDDILARANAQVEAVESAKGKLRMSVDFWLIRAAFIKVFGAQQGGKLFRDWVRKNRLSVTKPYGKRFKSD
ncbi:MAG: hypothetical protein ACQCN6_01735 [Candidatus Bathyarchaeia archaeon]